MHCKCEFKETKDIANNIADKLKNPSYDNGNIIKAIRSLAEWFENHKDEGEEHFTDLYRRRAELFIRTISDKESLYKIMKTSTDLSKLSEVAEAIENDPEILRIIAKRQREREEEIEKNEIGEKG